MGAIFNIQQKGFFLLFLFALLSITTFLPHADGAPINVDQPFRFDITSPNVNTEWVPDSITKVSWDTSLMPEGSTMDIALMQHAKKRSILLGRYIPSLLGSMRVNLGPEIEPGTYSLLLTVYKGRSSTVLGRSFVSSLSVVDDSEEADDVPSDVQSSGVQVDLNPDNIETSVKTFHFQKDSQNAILEDEPVQLSYESGSRSFVLMAPYTIGWSIPKALKDVPDTRVNILLVSKRTGEVERALRTNLDARLGFQFVFIPRDIARRGLYQIRIEIIGNGRKFVGYTHEFSTRLPAFAEAP
ncbi:hypothetical protein BGZ76_008327 [Entomortierella beljakovae]|nr:hypothetical protein BGZ76_008327 [Entomortierella beljakovae]